jgi:prepilin-type N-terminal cleavage/methylation domain-containing protein
MRGTGRRGFSLIEIVIALAVGAILMALVGSVFVSSLGAWRHGQNLREAQAHAATLVDVMTRDVRAASQTPSVRVHPPIDLPEGVPLLALSLPAAAHGGPAWIVYVLFPDRLEVQRQVVAFSPEGAAVVRESRSVGFGVARLSVEQVADGVTIEAEVKRDRAVGHSRTTAAPRNP